MLFLWYIKLDFCGIDDVKLTNRKCHICRPRCTVTTTRAFKNSSVSV